RLEREPYRDQAHQRYGALQHREVVGSSQKDRARKDRDGGRGRSNRNGGSMIFVNCEQGTPEWFQARAGVITASKFADAVSALKNGQPSQASKDYAYKVAIERIYGETTEDTYVTWEMKRGTDLEPLARMAYEMKSGNLAEESGIVLTDDRLFGYS